MSLLRFWTRILRPERGKADLKAELDAHLAMAIADHVSRGEDPADARRAVLREMGSLPLIEDTTRAKWGWTWLDYLRQDLRYALRQIRNHPRFAFAVIGTLALGIGAAAAMFTVVDHALLRSLPYPHARRLVQVEEISHSGNAFYGVTYPDFLLWRSGNRAFQSMAYYTGYGARTYLGDAHNVQQVAATLAGPDLFKVLGVQPLLGQAFAKGTPPDVILLSYTLWHLRFANDSHIVGKVVQLNGRSYTVIGVMPRGFDFPRHGEHPRVWMPVQLSAADYVRNANTPGYEVVARLRPGITIHAAQLEMQVRQRAILPLYSDAMTRQDHSGIRIRSYASTLEPKSAAHALLILLAATGVLWLIACVNVMNLLLARGTARRREMAMRSALGASRARILQQLMLESLVLSAIAALFGAGLATGGVRAFSKAITSHLALWHPLNLNWPILAALMCLTMVTALLASAWPALAAAFAPIEAALRKSGSAGLTRHHYRMRALLVVVQIAMSLVLLVSCGLLLRTLYALRHVPLGFRTDHILVAHLSIPDYRYARRNMTSGLFMPLLERVRHLPGVQAAGLVSQVPLGDTLELDFNLYLDHHGVKKKISAEIKSATPGLNQVFSFPMLAGRYFNAQDTATSRPVVVVNRAFAVRYSPDPNDPSKVLGLRLLKLKKGMPNSVIVGVLNDMHQDSIEQSHRPEVEVPLEQIQPGSSFYAWEGWSMDLAVRTHLPLKVFLPELSHALRQADPALANSKIETMNQIVADSYGSQTLAAHVLEFFGITALLLCISGLYGLLAYTVAQRRREIGVRMALGAPREAVQRLILRQALGMILPGVLFGAALSWFTAHLVRSYVFGVSAHDHWTFIIASLLLCASGVAAAWLPAARAASVQPAEAIREE